MRFALWALIAVVIVLLLTRGKKNASGAATQTRGTANGSAEPMVQCAYCGVHLPASEALASASGTVYCNEEHRLLHARP